MATDYLLMEDDCAPDAGEYFAKDLKDKFNLEIKDFKEKGLKLNPEDEGYIGYAYSGYKLEQWCDDPFWHLSVLEYL